MPQAPRRRFGPDVLGAFPLIALLSIPLGILAYAYLHGTVRERAALAHDTESLCFGSFLPLLFTSWLLAFQVELGPDAVVYRTLGTLLGRKRVPYEAIARLRIDVGRGPTAQGLAGMYRLVFVGASGEVLLVVNMKPFSRAALGAIVRGVIARRPEVQRDAGVVALAERDDLGPTIARAIPQIVATAICLGAGIAFAAGVRAALAR